MEIRSIVQSSLHCAETIRFELRLSNTAGTIIWFYNLCSKIFLTICLLRFSQIPSQMELTKSFCCGPCQTGPFSIVASIPQSGFVPGQVIKVSTEVTNMSTIPVDEMKFLLRKIVSYHSQTPTSKTKVEVVDIQERRVGGVPENDHGRFLVSLPVPPVPPTNINLCKVIHIMYEIKIEARLPGLHKNPYILIPITIGTIPLNLNYPDPKYPTINTISEPVITVQPLPNTYSHQEMNEACHQVAVVDSADIPNQSENSAENGMTNTSNRTPIINPITHGGAVPHKNEMRKRGFFCYRFECLTLNALLYFSATIVRGNRWWTPKH